MKPIYLDVSEAKCIGSACKHPKPCARRDIPMVKGRPLGDFSQPLKYIPDCCASTGWAKFISYDMAVPPAQKPQVKEWVGR